MQQNERSTKPTGQAPPDTTPQRDALDDVPALLVKFQRLQLQVEMLKEALAISEQETAIAREKLGRRSESEPAVMRENTLLKQTVDRLRSELLRLEKKDPARQFSYKDRRKGKRADVAMHSGKSNGAAAALVPPTATKLSTE